MKIDLLIPSAGAGKWAWQGWLNAFKALGHSVNDIANQKVTEPDLLICSTSTPREDIIEWRREHLECKLALNVLAWTNDEWPGINNAGVQASEGNVEYAKQLKPDIVFAQYSPKYRTSLLKNWHEKEGYKLGSMEMAADSTIYNLPQSDETYGAMRPYDMVYVGGYWHYKGININEWLIPVFRKHNSKLLLVGKGWPMQTKHIDDEASIGYFFKHSKVCPNIHEPHSTFGGFDVVERVFKTMYCGGLCISDHVNEMEDGFGLIPNVHLITTKSSKEYAEIIDEIMSDHKGAWDFMQEAGQKFVTENHTYIHRAQQLLADLGV